MQLAKDDLTGKTVALKIVFLNKSGLKPEEVRIVLMLSSHAIPA